MRRPLVFLFTGVVAIALLTASLLIPTLPASAAPIAGAPTTYCADPDTDPSMDTGAGTMITCDTTITNTITGIDPISGVASGGSVIRITECTGPASGRLDPGFLTCTTDEQILVNLVTHVKQCDAVGYGGGNVLDCSVEVINNFVGVTPQVILAATVDQCVGSAPVTTGCHPFPATTTNATITQCNNSSYGGGQEDFNCDASGTTTASLSVTVNQCNNSNYGGGSWLNCAASLSNNVISLATPPPTTAPTGAPTTAPTGAPTTAPTATPTNAPTGAPTIAPTGAPTIAPTGAPTIAPTGAPTIAPTGAPTIAPTGAPTIAPTGAPTIAPTGAPTIAPTGAPTIAPTGAPTIAPTIAPTGAPTIAPTGAPTATPVGPTATPVGPAATPSTAPTAQPVVVPTVKPTPGLPDTSTSKPPTPQQGGTDFLLFAGLFVLALPLWMVYVARGVRSTSQLS